MSNIKLRLVSDAGGIGSRNGKGPTKWGGPQVSDTSLSYKLVFLLEDKNRHYRIVV